MTKDPVRKAWQGMIQRCENLKHRAYRYYGARGITVCNELHDFNAFKKILGDRPPGMTLDRIDNDKGYSPDNIRWATRKTQQRNKRNNRLLTMNGQTKCISAWREDGLLLAKSTIQKRIILGWPEKDAFLIPPKKQNPQIITFNGKMLPLAALCKSMNISYTLVHKRMHRGWPVEKALKF